VGSGRIAGNHRDAGAEHRDGRVSGHAACDTLARVLENALYLLGAVVVPAFLFYFLGYRRLAPEKRKGALKVCGVIVLFVLVVVTPIAVLSGNAKQKAMCEEVARVNPQAAALPRERFMDLCSHTSTGVTECMKPELAAAYPAQCRPHEAAIRELMARAATSP
jgi:hypothetical protein